MPKISGIQLSTISLFFFGVLLSGNIARPAIFGVDNRLPINESSPHYESARSTAVSILKTMYEIRPDGKIDFGHYSLKDRMCSGEKFSDDTSLTWSCTGFLIAPDILATAGHCMVNVGESKNETELYCDSFSWLFGYNDSLSGKNPLKGVDPENFYQCRQIIYAVIDQEEPFRDFALVQLDRPVTGRNVLTLSNKGVKPSDIYHMIGYPLGGPAKATLSGRLSHNDLTQQSFMTNLDALPGNSGSPVMNQQNEVVGILIGGTPYRALLKSSEKDSTGKIKSCDIYNRCSENGSKCTESEDEEDLKEHHGVAKSGTDIQRIEPVIELLREFEKSRQADAN